MENGFLRDNDSSKEIKKKKENELILPLKENKKCEYCDNLRLDLEISKTFNKNVCYDCKFSKLELITKTTALREYLLSNEEIAKMKYLSKPNPRKGTWHDMQLYDKIAIEKRAIEKFGTLEKLEEEKMNRKRAILERKKKKTRTKIKDLRKKTLVENKLKDKKHKHEFKTKGNKRICECGMVVESEEL